MEANEGKDVGFLVDEIVDWEQSRQRYDDQLVDCMVDLICGGECDEEFQNELEDPGSPVHELIRGFCADHGRRWRWTVEVKEFTRRGSTDIIAEGQPYE